MTDDVVPTVSGCGTIDLYAEIDKRADQLQQGIEAAQLRMLHERAMIRELRGQLALLPRKPIQRTRKPKEEP